MQRLLCALVFALASTAAAAALNLNTATHDELVALPGIGPVKAQAILDYRKAHGSFKSVEELKDVKGIGAKRYEKLKGELTVGAGPAKASARPDDKEKEKAAAAPQRSAKGDVSVAAKGSAPAAKP